MLLAARHEDGSPMCEQELRDELMTLLVAGHETTASELAWAFERLARTPAGHAPPDRGDRRGRRRRLPDGHRPGDAAPAAGAAERRAAAGEGADRDRRLPLPEGVCLAPNAYLIHHDPEIYPDPYAFRPERFLDEPPGTYTWIPFGGGRRRCLGASFAQLEMKIVLRAVLSRAEPEHRTDGHEGSRRRAITLSPRRSAVTVLRSRERARTPVAA